MGVRHRSGTGDPPHQRWYEKAGLPRDAVSSPKTHSIRCKKETGYEEE
jgi:hypothetical protein